MATLAQAIDQLRPEFPARDRLLQALITLIDDGDSYLSTVSKICVRLIRKMVANLRQGNLRPHMRYIRERYQEFQDAYRDKSKETEWHRLHNIIACDYDKLTRDDPHIAKQKTNFMKIKMINGQIHSQTNSCSLTDNTYTGSGIIYPKQGSSYIHVDMNMKKIRSYDEQITVINVLPCGLTLISLRRGNLPPEQYLRDFVTGESVRVESLRYPQNVIINDFGQYVPIKDDEFICMKLFGDLGPDFTIIALV